MKAHIRFLCLFLGCLGLGVVARAQLTGTKTIPSTNYPTLKVAVDSLNLYGVGTSGVTFTFSSATTETAPVGGYQLGSATLNASTSSGKQVTINGNGTVINAYVGTSTTADGMFYIMGTDWVNINGLNLSESAANTTTTQQMEWGYSLVKLTGTAPFDGCQNVAINNCTISLAKAYVNTIGIRAAHSIAGTATVLTTTGATAASTNSYNKFTGNIINNVTRGINLIGISSPVAVYDKRNEIGGSSASFGNTITVGGATNTSYGVNVQYDSVITINYNNFFVNATQGNTAVYEVNMATGCGDLTVTNNRFDVNCAMSSAYMYGYWNSSAHTDPGSGLNAASTHTISNNTITGNNTAATSSYLYGLYEYNTYSKNLYMDNNKFRDIDWNTSTGYLYLLYQYNNLSPYIEINNNDFYNISQRQTTTGGYIYGIYAYNASNQTGKTMVQNNTMRRIKSNYYFYAFYNMFSTVAPPAGYPYHYAKVTNNWVDSVDFTTAPSTAYLYSYLCYYGGDSTEASYNKFTNVRGNPTTGTLGCVIYNYGNYGPNKYTVKGNLVENFNCFNFSGSIYLGYYATLVDSNIVRNINWTGTSGSMATFLGYYGAKYVSSNNRVYNISGGGSSAVSTYMGYYGSDAEVKNNAITNYNLSGNAYINNYIGYNVSNSCDVHHNRVDSITQGTGTTAYPWYSYANGSLSIHDNILSNFTTGSTSISLYPFYLAASSATSATTFYNNLLTNINVPAAYANTASCGVLCYTAGAPYTLYHNTIRINPGVPGGAGYGFTGIYYQTTGNLDLRNNIIHVNVTPTTGGFTSALRRAGGATGISPSNFLGTSNSNIYYTPNVPNSYLYCKGTSAATVVNPYHLSNDPNFNSPCGLFKSFLGHDQASFTENNLASGAIASTYVPSGVSYAEKGAVPTSNPTVTTDYANVTRGAVADIGALEFSGTPLDNAPPIISYTPLPKQSYCSTCPTLQVTITDNSGVNNTTGTAPRLYYKKSSENNAIGGNTSSFNGWKYVEASTVSGSVYTFVFDCSLLTSSLSPGDSVHYFVIAQDNASPVNAGASVIGFPVCPLSVALTSTHAPTNSSPVPNGFKVLSTPVFKASAFPGSSCGPGNTVYNIVPTPLGAAVQWQSATMTGTFSNIPGATNTTYSTPTNTVTMLYRALILCGTSTLTTTSVDTFVIASPAILSTVGDTVCGYDTTYLSAIVTPFTTAKWYTTATGGTSFYSGNTYKNAPRMTSVTYYVSANTPNASTEMVTKTPVAASSTYLDGAGLEMRFRNPATNFYSTTVFPVGANGSFYVELRDSTDTPIPGYSAGPFTVSGGTGVSMPVVLNLNWKNIPAGRYFLVQTGISGSPYLTLETSGFTYPYNSPSGNVSIINGKYSTTNYYTFFYNNIVGADCESKAPRTPVTAVVSTPPAITATSPNVPGICLGNSATLNVTSPNPSYTYTWTARPGATVLTGASQTVSPTVTTTYDMLAFDPYTGCKNYDSIRINVNPLPNPPTIAPINPTTCGGKPVLLVATAPPGPAGMKTLGAGTVSMSAPSPFYGYYTGGRSQYLIKSSELFAAGVKPGPMISLAFQHGAAGSVVQNFEIRLANVSMTAVPSSITCAPGMVSVFTQASFTPPASGWTTFTFNGGSFSWTGGDLLVDVSHINCPNCPTTSCTNFASPIATVLGTTMGYQASVHVYADGNCGIIACPTSGSPISTVTSTSRPNMQIGYREPYAVNWLNVSSLYKTASLSSTVSLTDTNSVVYSAPPATTVYTAVTNASGCLSAPSLPDTVKVIPAPVVTVTPAGPQTICAGQPVTLCIPTGANQIYQWYLNNVAISGANANCYVAAAAGSYRVAATNIVTGCSDTSIATVLTVNAAPTVTITANGPTTICNGTNLVLTANSGTAVAWQWQLNGANIPGATTSNYTVSTAGGNYTVVVTSTNSCATTSAPVTITVNTTPGTVTPNGSTSFCTGGNVVLQAPTGTGLSYQWYDGTGTPLPGETNSTYTATATGNYYVVVTNTSTSCSTTSISIPVTVGAGPNSSITPQGTISGCQGGTVTLRAVLQPGLCYQWYLGGVAIPGANLDSFVASSAGVYTVDVSICATPSCVSTTQSPTTINVNPLPSATITPSTVSPICQGDSTVLSANTGANLSYQWELAGVAISGATGSTYAAKSNGNYTVRVTNTTTGCTNLSAAVAMTVRPAPNSTITAAGNPTFCQGGSVVLNASTAGISNYQWYLNGSPAPGSSTSASYTANATGLYTVKVTGTNGCAATSASTSVQVNALPDVTTVPSGNAAVCQGYTTALTVTAGPGLTYQWYNGATPINGATSNTYTTGTGGTYNVKVTNTVTGCFATSNSIVLSVNTPPIATAAATGNTTICQDDSVKLSANAGTGFVYQWKYNGVDIAGGNGSVYYAKAAGRYTVSVSNATNCTTLSNSIQITVNPRPAAYITYNTPLEFCDGSAVVLNANAGTGLSYQWYLDGVALPNTSNINVSSVSGAYTLKVTNTFLCVNTADTLDITVWPAPVPTITRAGSTLTTAQPYTSYQWFFNNNALGGATSASYTFTQNGAYKVRVVDANGCEGNSNQYFINNVGISQTTAGRSIKVYPNPSNGIVHIDASVKIKVVLRDVTGRTILEEKDVKEINLGDVATGAYLLYITDMEGNLLRVEKLSKSDR